MFFAAYGALYTDFKIDAETEQKILVKGSEYVISELGKSLVPIIDSMLKWGETHMDLFAKKYGKHL